MSEFLGRTILRKNHEHEYQLTIKNMMELCKAAIVDGVNPNSPIHITMNNNRLTIHEISANEVVWRSTGKRTGPYLRIHVSFSQVVGEIISN